MKPMKSSAYHRVMRALQFPTEPPPGHGDAVLAMALKLDGFLAVFPRNVKARTTPPGAMPYVSVNQQLIGS
jgi:hypothetical protein